MSHDLPDFQTWNIALVRLLKGVVYSDDARVWDLALANQSRLSDYVARLGLRLVVDEPEGMAYLRQLSEDERPDGYDDLPRLFHSTRLSYGATLMCVMLRDELRRFEEEDVQNDRCVVEEPALWEQWKTFFPSSRDEVKLNREMAAAFRNLTDLGFVKRFSEDPPAWEVRRILKARLPVADLEDLKTRLEAAAQRRMESDGDETNDDHD